MEELLKKKSPKLTPTQKRVFKYIFNHLEEAIFLTSSTLAKKTGVSEATIVRLAQALGFEGFPDFQRSLRSQFQERVTTISRLEKTLQGPETSTPFLKILNMEIKNVSALADKNSGETFDAAVAQLWKAKKILVVGMRSAYSLAVYLKFGLRFLGKEVTLLEPAQWDIWDQLVTLRPQTFVVAISFPRYARMTTNVVAYAREKQCKILSITDSIVSPLTPYSDLTLFAPCQSYSYMDSFTAPMSLIHMLLTAMSLKWPEKAIQAFKKLEGIWDERNVYYSPPAENTPNSTIDSE